MPKLSNTKFSERYRIYERGMNAITSAGNTFGGQIVVKSVIILFRNIFSNVGNVSCGLAIGVDVIGFDSAITYSISVLPSSTNPVTHQNQQRVPQKPLEILITTNQNPLAPPKMCFYVTYIHVLCGHSQWGPLVSPCPRETIPTPSQIPLPISSRRSSTSSPSSSFPYPERKHRSVLRFDWAEPLSDCPGMQSHGDVSACDCACGSEWGVCAGAVEDFDEAEG
ncbi:hypothetical protein MMC14_007601 [Varicellaria rhodocarpa]|nr:hypothetical protein [Varicellaria rhodocarpa]